MAGDFCGQSGGELIGLDWIGLDWIGLDWIGLDWIGLDWIGLDWIVVTICMLDHFFDHINIHTIHTNQCNHYVHSIYFAVVVG
jgi:hypothetical protein